MYKRQVQNIGRKTAEILKLIPDVSLNIVERCSGHAGTYGVKKEFHKTSMKIGRPVFKSMSSKNPKFVSSDCQLAGHHIMQGISDLILRVDMILLEKLSDLLKVGEVTEAPGIGIQLFYGLKLNQIWIILEELT